MLVSAVTSSYRPQILAPNRSPFFQPDPKLVKKAKIFDACRTIDLYMGVPLLVTILVVFLKGCLDRFR